MSKRKANEEAKFMWKVYVEGFNLFGLILFFPFVVAMIAINWTLETLFCK